MDFWTVRWRAPGRLPWKTLATFPPRVPSPKSATERYSAGIKSQKVKTNRDTGRLTTTGRAPLVKADFLSKQTGPPVQGSHLMPAPSSTSLRRAPFHPGSMGGIYTAAAVLASCAARFYRSGHSLTPRHLRQARYRHARMHKSIQQIGYPALADGIEHASLPSRQYL